MQEARRRREEDLEASDALEEKLDPKAYFDVHYLQNTPSMTSNGSAHDQPGMARQPSFHRLVASISARPAVSRILHATVLLAAILSVYLVDIYVIATERAPAACDIAVYSIIAACFLILALDWALSALCTPSFPSSILMWSHALGALSMLPDLAILACLLSGPDACA
eukprot:CAMPEP_0172212892 /NCGR_PEP_ID=MMETSP1050-20130122/37286_1 /TAXON_ID=233186 /ORGANISM="Cryptomonas curvata, Strain CCAP979/52" /LENGTH=166 /DNA_ID=CAMNT_0012893657 /DNA_START=541 /DNA_END=1038 /DNA_ORIENTATION=+